MWRLVSKPVRRGAMLKAVMRDGCDGSLCDISHVAGMFEDFSPQKADMNPPGGYIP